MAGSEDKGGAAPPEVPEDLKTALASFLSESDSGDGGVERASYEVVAGYVQELLAERDGGHNEIDTRSGETIRPLDPDPEKIKLEDIAHGLSNVGRFAGQGEEFYSVARHSVHVSLEVEAQGGSREAQRYALVHDAAEAYLSDVPGPVKKSLPGYKRAERRLDAAVANALGLGVTDEEREIVEEADADVGQRELAVEFPDRGHNGAELEHNPDEEDEEIEDKALFLDRASNLELR